MSRIPNRWLSTALVLPVIAAALALPLVAYSRPEPPKQATRTTPALPPSPTIDPQVRQIVQQLQTTYGRARTYRSGMKYTAYRVTKFHAAKDRLQDGVITFDSQTREFASESQITYRNDGCLRVLTQSPKGTFGSLVSPRVLMDARFSGTGKAIAETKYDFSARVADRLEKGFSTARAGFTKFTLSPLLGKHFDLLGDKDILAARAFAAGTDRTRIFVMFKDSIGYQSLLVDTRHGVVLGEEWVMPADDSNSLSRVVIEYPNVLLNAPVEDSQFETDNFRQALKTLAQANLLRAAKAGP